MGPDDYRSKKYEGQTFDYIISNPPFGREWKNEKVKVERPITLEERLSHLASKNGNIREMIERLDLDVE